MKKNGFIYVIFIILTLAAISTIIPDSHASKECLLGFKAHCSFTPISTVICLFAAAVLYKFGKKFFKSN